LLANNEPFYAYTWRGYWRDIGSASSYLQANMDVLAGKVEILPPPSRERGEKFDEAAEIDAISVVDPSCAVKAGAQIINSVIGRNCYIEERARIENSVVRGGSRIGSGATLDGAIVGRSCHIGRSVTVASGAALGDKTALTDFTQI
jgi:NDP-sugar pyrophosphorylase family protein